MATPFRIQAPENIAKEYAGNKQKIALAAQMGIVDPTAAVLAGMFIDRMRSAQVMENAQQPTVAQQVLGAPQPQGMGAPPAPPQGMGAPPPQGMGAPPQGMGAPPPQQMPMAPPPQGMGAPPQGMAAGGLTTLPVPNAMFDEPDNGGYAGGGMIAFAAGDVVDEYEDEFVEDGPTIPGYEMGVGQQEIIATGAAKPSGMPLAEAKVPSFLSGFHKNPTANLESLNELAPQKTKQSERLAKEFERTLDPEEQKRRRKEDMWMTLGQIGARMAQTPGSLLQAASAGIGEALPGAREAAKERRAEVREAVKTLAEQEGVSNKAAREAAAVAIEMTKNYGTLAEAMKDRAFRAYFESKSLDQQLLIQQMANATQLAAASMGANASMFGSRVGANAQVESARIGAGRDLSALRKAAMDQVREDISPFGGAYSAAYKAEAAKGPQFGTAFVNKLVNAYMSGSTPSADGKSSGVISVPWPK